jgi:hypothetical protein
VLDFEVRSDWIPTGGNEGGRTIRLSEDLGSASHTPEFISDDFTRMDVKHTQNTILRQARQSHFGKGPTDVGRRAGIKAHIPLPNQSIVLKLKE